MSAKAWTNRQPWKASEVQPIVLPESGFRKSSLHSDVTVIDYLPRRQKSRRRFCGECATPVSPSDCFCGWCGVRLERA